MFPDITISWGRKLPVFLFDRVAEDYGNLKTTGFATSNTTDRALAVAQHASQSHRGIKLQHFDVMVTGKEGMEGVKKAAKGKVSKYNRTFRRLQAEAMKQTADDRVQEIGEIYKNEPSVTPLVINVDGTCGPELWALIEKCGDHLYPETVSDKYKSDRAKFHAKYLRLIQSAVTRECAPILRQAATIKSRELSESVSVEVC